MDNFYKFIIVKKNVFFCLLIAFGLLFAKRLDAATYTLTTAGAGAAQTPGNWNTGGTGGGGTAASNFTTAGDMFVIANGTAATFGASTTFGSSTAAVTLQVDGSFSVSTGTVTVGVSGANSVVLFSNSSSTQVTSGTFTLAAGSTLKTTNANGIKGTNCSIAAAAGGTLSTTANYEFNGTGNQVTLGLPASVTNLSINNGANTVTLSAGITVSGTLNIASGSTLNFGTTARTVNLSGTGTNTLNSLGTIDMSGGNAAHEIWIYATSIANFGTLINGTTTTANTVRYLGTNYIINATPTYNILRIDGNGTVTASGNITIAANGRLWIYGATFDLGTNTANCLTGGSATFYIQGNLIVGGTNNFPANYATYTFDGNRTITYNRNGDQTLFTKAGFAYDCWLVLSGSGTKQVTGQPLAYTSGLGYSTTINAGVTLDLNGINNNTISTLLGSGTIDNLNTSATDTYTLNINTPGVHGTFSGLLKNTYGKVAINKQGIYTQTLSGLNTYSGGTTISNGIIALGISSSSADSGPLGAASGGITVLSGASLFMNGFSLTGAAGQALSLNGNGYGGAGGYGALSNYSGSGTPTYSGLITLTGNTQIFGDLNITNPGTITGSGFNLTLRSTTTLGSSIASIIGTGAGTVTLTTDAGQTWTFSGANTYTGKTIISAGTLSINTIADVNGGSSALGAPTTAANGTIDIAGTGTLKYTGTGHSSDRIINLTASGGTIDASGNGTLTLRGDITGNARGLVLTGTGSGIQNGVINTTTGTLTKNGQGTWILSGLNTYTGITTVNNGSLIAGIAHSGGANGAFGNASPINLNGGNLSTGETTGFTQKMGTLTVSNNSTLTLGTGEHSITFASAGSFSSARILTIADWQGYPGESGTAGQVIFTANPSAVLGQIRFLIGPAYYKATSLGTGPYEVVPTGTPEGNVSVEAFKKADDFSLQVNPNPFTHSASIRMEGKTGASFIWECMDLNGRIIETGRIHLNDGTTQANVCHTCAPGSYLLKIRDINQNKQQTLRLIKTE